MLKIFPKQATTLRGGRQAASCRECTLNRKCLILFSFVVFFLYYEHDMKKCDQSLVKFDLALYTTLKSKLLYNISSSFSENKLFE